MAKKQRRRGQQAAAPSAAARKAPSGPDREPGAGTRDRTVPGHEGVMASHADLAVGAASLAYGLVQWWPTRRLPYHWDSASFVIREARDFAAHGFLPWVTRTDVGFAHPPTLPTLVALVWRTFGDDRLWPHLLMLPVLPALIFATYLLGRRVGGLVVGICSAAIVAVLPVALAEYGVIYMDLPEAALGTLALAAWMAGRPRACAVALAMAVLCKLTAALVAVVVVVDALARRRPARDWLTVLIPVAATVLVWLGYHRWATGWWLMAPGRQSLAPADFVEIVIAFRYVASEMWWNQGRWTLALSIPVAAAVAWIRSRGVGLPGALSLAVGQMVAVSFFVVMGELLTRYLLPFLPMLVVLSCALVAKATAQTVVGVWTAIMVTVQILCWHPAPPPQTVFEMRPPPDLRYRDYIELGVQLATFLRAEHPNALVYGAVPEEYQLTEPWQGYVDEPIRFHGCADFTWQDEEQLIVEHSHSKPQQICRMLLDRIPAVRLVRELNAGGTWLRVWTPLRARPAPAAP